MSKLKVNLIIFCIVISLLCGVVTAANNSYTPTNQITSKDNPNLNAHKSIQDPYNTRLKKHYNGPNGIADALSDPQFKEGDTILVGKGVYNFLDISKRVNLIAVQPNAVIKGVNVGSLSMFNKKNYLTLYGFVINNPSGSGVSVTDSNGVKLIHNLVMSGISDTGLLLDNSNKNIVSLNTIKDGMILDGSSDNILTKNFLKDSENVGLLLKNSMNNIISKNIITGSSDEGLALENAVNTLIFQNRILDNGKSGIRMDDSKNCLIGNSKVTSNGGDGIRLTGSSNTLIFNNTVSRNRNGGIFLSDSINNLLTGNTIINNVMDGIYISVSSVNTLIVSNTLLGNMENQIFVNVGTNEGTSKDPQAISLAPYQAFYNRIIATEGKYALLNTGTSTVNAVHNWWGSNSGPGTKISGNVLANPWIIMSISADPKTITTGGRSLITADFLHDSNGKFLDPSIVHVPDGIPVLFSTDLGILGNSNSILRLTQDGVATAILKAGNDPGIAHVTATADGFTAGPVNVTIVSAINPSNNVNALEKTIPMEKTGIPVGMFLSGILVLLVGIVASRR